MNYIEKLTKSDLKSLLNKNWMTHDAMWFKLSVENIGIKKTNQINRAAVRAMAKIEITRVLKLLDLKYPKSVDDLVSIIHGTLSLFGENYFEFEIIKVNDTTLQFHVNKCFAYEGVKKLGLIEEYECGIYDRVEGWFEALDIAYRSNIDFLGCLMHRDDSCIKNYQFNFRK
ncbi:MAG: DUF6125 family protein [Candidatus Hodarchaeales archaeon]|jgi:hypothetical protein